MTCRAPQVVCSACPDRISAAFLERITCRMPHRHRFFIDSSTNRGNFLIFPLRPYIIQLTIHAFLRGGLGLVHLAEHLELVHVHEIQLVFGRFPVVAHEIAPEDPVEHDKERRTAHEATNREGLDTFWASEGIGRPTCSGA